MTKFLQTKLFERFWFLFLGGQLGVYYIFIIINYLILLDKLNLMAEGMGFEPTIQFNPYTGLANQRLQPLGHPSCVGLGRETMTRKDAGMYELRPEPSTTLTA